MRPAVRRVHRLAARAAGWAADYAYILTDLARGTRMGAEPRGLTVGDGVPVLLLPGIYETWSFLAPVAGDLHRAGHPVHGVPALRRNALDLAPSTEHVVRRVLDLGLDRVVLVAHSKGGLIGKAAMADPRVAERVMGMVAVNTPFAGSRYATYFPARAVPRLGPRDPHLAALATATDLHSRIVSVYADFDPHVPGGSHLAGARNLRLEDVGHFRVIGRPAVRALVVREVAALAAAPA